ncbi:GNAT family N-acetyltransferase [Paenibacillus sp. MBLB4367]|uniref:GNAT family N-acetyltransferase n=1 Tax=Paenibacillus sp. MBLB4367 TaxID=3384767 RepID=UPI003908301C
MQPFEPLRPESFYTLETQREQIVRSEQGRRNDAEYVFGVFLGAGETELLVGRIALTGVARGPFQNANLGYFLGKAFTGKGYGKAAVGLAVSFAFGEIGLHRVQAAVMPWNKPSIGALERNSFEYERLAKKYLQINGIWEDHNIYALTVETWRERPDNQEVGHSPPYR